MGLPNGLPNGFPGSQTACHTPSANGLSKRPGLANGTCKRLAKRLASRLQVKNLNFDQSVSDYDIACQIGIHIGQAIVHGNNVEQNFDQGCEYLDLIVSDEEGDRIGVTIKNFYKPKYEALLKIQHNYIIRNAFVGTNPFKGRTTHWNHESKLNINHETSVLPLPESEWNCENGFKFIPFDEILDETKTKEHVTTDVIERVSNYSLEKQYRDGDDLQSTYIVIELKDLNDNLLSCTLWGTSDQDCVILIVHSGRTKKHGDMTVRSDWNFTQVSLNADVEPVHVFRKRLLEIHTTQDSQTSLAPTLTPPGKQLDGWFNQLSPGLHAIQAQIIVVLPDDEWSYIGCRKCHRIVKPIEPVGDQTLDIDALLYKVNVRVEDTTDESNGTASLTLFETQVLNIIGKSAYELHKSTPEGQDQPDELDTLIGKKCIFKVEVSEYNLKQSNLIFTVKDASEGEAFVEKFVEEYKKQKCGSSNGSDETPTVDLSNTTGYTPPKKVVKKEGREKPLSVKSSTSKAM
ncbi:uncharacterized protein [Rutidosis leptorrhynchoides]|uniref:uncharacterized protein n=1 Tax=Rutidosis leptorrhynchoides TaxID=125765 RepID=UPI003A9A4B9C